MKLTRINRIVKLLTTLQSGRRLSLEELIAEMAVSRRTIFRDLKVLEEIGIPYNFNDTEGGYGIEPEFFLPSLDLNLQEALALLMLIHEGARHMSMPFRSSAVLGGIKIENSLPEKVQNYCNATLENISIKPESHAPMDALDKIFWQLQRASQKKRKVKITYNSFFEGGHIKTTLSPYHIHYNNRAWYVIGHSSLHKEIRTFKLNRIAQLEIMDKCFVTNSKFDIQDYFGRAWSMIPEGKLYNIKLRFMPKVAKNVCEVHWHQTQKVTHNNDGTATVEFRVDGLREISWWILGYGDQVKVIKPAALKKRIIATAEKMIKMNT